nr:hypothetical protein Iba_scaffold30320CG0010 [Ipomoea batatas]GMC98527.1 hypothetical protein Iba_chr05dCG17360 [Ipomoea batatas]
MHVSLMHRVHNKHGKLNSDLKISSNGVAVRGKKSSCFTTELMTSEYFTARLSDMHRAGAMAKHLTLFLSILPNRSRLFTTTIVNNAATPEPRECPAKVRV